MFPPDRLQDSVQSFAPAVRSSEMKTVSAVPGSAGTPETVPSISVIICTYNRGERILTTVRSILGSSLPDFELIIVDQSNNETTAEAMMPLLEDTRLRYLRHPVPNKSIALNLGLTESRAEIVAMTDDDCEVPSDWLGQMRALFVENPQVAVAYCRVEPVPYDPTAGYTPGFPCAGDRLLTQMRQCHYPHGIGAGMAVRRSAALALGGFDEGLGPGATFPSYEDFDIAIRALLHGYPVYETNRVAVLHDGFRETSAFRMLLRRDVSAMGSVLVKFLRCGQWRALPICAYDLWQVLLQPLFWHLLRLRKPPVALRAKSYLEGFLRAWRVPVDRKNCLFSAPQGEGRTGLPSLHQKPVA